MKQEEWHYAKSETGVRYIRDSRGLWIADVHCNTSGLSDSARKEREAEADANGHLLAAARDLLAACRRDAELANTAIAATPTNAYRNRLTGINILRLAAIARATKK